MERAKVVIKQKGLDEHGFVYVSKCKGEEGLCFTMAMGVAISIAKKSGISLTKIKGLVTDIYKETEDVK